MTLQRNTRGERWERITHYGLPVQGKEEVTVAKKKVTTKVVATKKAVFKPLSDEVTPYGALKYRIPARKDEFTGAKGTRPEAVILDIDGTIQGWGAGLDVSIKPWLEGHYKKDRVFVVITARDHDWQYESSFNWLMRNLPYPFIGPFARSKDDPRYASEFKRELAEDLSAVFDFVGAADDNTWVLKMWDQWAKDHFEDPADFDIFEAGYGSYADWRHGLAPKPGSSGTSGWGTPAGVPAMTPHRVAGTSRWDSATQSWIAPEPVKSGESLADRPEWKSYFDERYGSEAQDVTGDLTGLRADLEDIVAHNYHYTPAEIESMDTTELRELSGITDNDHRDYLVERINYRFDSRYEASELDELSTSELEELAQILPSDGLVPFATADVFVDDRIDAGDVDEAKVEFDPAVRKARIQERILLEDEVYAEYPDLDHLVIAKMETAELELLLDAADKLRGEQFTPAGGAQVSAS